MVQLGVEGLKLRARDGVRTIGIDRQAREKAAVIQQHDAVIRHGAARLFAFCQFALPLHAP